MAKNMQFFLLCSSLKILKNFLATLFFKGFCFGLFKNLLLILFKQKIYDNDLISKACENRKFLPNFIKDFIANKL